MSEKGIKGPAENSAIDLAIIHEDLAEVDTEAIRTKLQAQSKTLLSRIKAVNPKRIFAIKALLFQKPEGSDVASDDFEEEDRLEFETRLAEIKGDYNTALHYLLVSLRLQIESSGAPWAATCLKVGNQFNQLGNFNRAKAYYRLAIQIKLEVEKDENEDRPGVIVSEAREKLLSLSSGEMN